MFKKIAIIIIIVALLTISTTIPASTIDKKIKNEKPTIEGCIYGEVGNSHGVYTWTFYPFALVTSGLKRSRCNFYGQYSMKLSLNTEHFVTAHVRGFKPLTKKVYLTDEKPTKEIFFDMYASSPSARSVNNEKNCYGVVHGAIRYSPDGYYGDMPSFYTVVKLGDKIDFLSYFTSYYKFRGLELDKEYTITYSHRNFHTKTVTFTLTEDQPNLELNLFFYSDDEDHPYSKKATLTR